MNLLSHNRGFTLLEVLISIFILTLISISGYQLITSSYQLRDSLSGDSDFYSEIRLSIGVLEKDFSLLYTPVIMLPPQKEPSKNSKKEQPQIAQQPVGSEFWGDLADKTGVRYSRFIGTEDEMKFIASSHIRIYKESKESTFSKITYSLEDNPFENEDDPEEMKGTKVLVKKEDTDVFNIEEDSEETTKTYPILYGIKKLTYRYFHKEKDRWEDSWDSNSRDFKNIYPDIVEMTIEVVGPDRHFFEGKFLFKPEVPIRGIPTSS